MNYRLSYFRTENSMLVPWNKLPESIVEKVPSSYFMNVYGISKESDEYEFKKITYVALDPVKKFRKKETTIEICDGVVLGLDD